LMGDNEEAFELLIQKANYALMFYKDFLHLDVTVLKAISYI